MCRAFLLSSSCDAALPKGTWLGSSASTTFLPSKAEHPFTEPAEPLAPVHGLEASCRSPDAP